MTSSNFKKVVAILTFFFCLVSCSNSLNKQNLLGKWDGYIGCGTKESIVGSNLHYFHWEFFSNDSFINHGEMHKIFSGTWALNNKQVTISLDSTKSLTFEVDKFRADYLYFTIPNDSISNCFGEFKKIEE